MYQQTKVTCFSALAISLALSMVCNKAYALDINLGGSTNLNFNPINNNKYTTPLQNLSPGSSPWQQVDLSPLATPPPTSSIKVYSGNRQGLEVVDKDFQNAKDFKAEQRRTGQYIGKAPEAPDDDQEVKDTDIQSFLGNYYKYLHTEGLSSSSLPIIKDDNVPAKMKPAKTKATSYVAPSAKKELKAEQKLLISNSDSNKSNPNSP